MQGNRKHKRGTEGIETRHARSCPGPAGGRCACSPSYRAVVWSPRDHKVVRSEWFRDLAAAKGWRDDARSAVRKGTLRSPVPTTLRQAGEALVAGMRDGSVRTRSGDRFKPGTVREYQRALEVIYPELGAMRVGDVRRADLQALVDRLLGEGRAPSTIRNALMPLRVIYRRAMARDDVGVNPTAGLELPAVRNGRMRIASPEEAAALVAALPAGDRALWATAFYAGLRRGELRALRWEHVDLAAGVIRVESSWDPYEGAVEPKSRAGRRTVPVALALRDHLAEHRLATGREAGLVFGSDGEHPFDPSTAVDRANRAWGWREVSSPDLEGPRTIWIRARDNALEPIGLHECRHTYASLMIAAGVNAKTLCSYMGHASIQITFDRYGHLMPGNEDEAAALLDAYLERANTAARLHALEQTA
jgi:integrase